MDQMGHLGREQVRLLWGEPRQLEGKTSLPSDRVADAFTLKNILFRGKRMTAWSTG